MKKIKNNEGYITAATLMMFIFLSIILAILGTVTVNSLNISKRNQHYSETFRYSEYGLNKAKDVMRDTIESLTEEDLEIIQGLYEEHNLEPLVNLLNEELEAIDEDKETGETLSVRLIPTERDDEFILESVATNQRTNHKRVLNAKVDLVAFMSNFEEYELPSISEAVIAKDSLTLDGGTINGVVSFLNPSDKSIKIKSSFGDITETENTEGKIYIYSPDGKYTNENAHEVFDLGGMPYDTATAEKFFHVGRHSNGEGYIIGPRLDKVEVINKELSMPTVKAFKDYSYINKKPARVTLTPKWGSDNFEVVDKDGNLKMPTDIDKYTNARANDRNAIAVTLENGAYYPNFEIPDTWGHYVLRSEGGPGSSVTILTDNLTFAGNVSIEEGSNITIIVSDKNLKNPHTASNFVKISPKSLDTRDGEVDRRNKAVMFAIDTPKELENNPLKILLSNSGSLSSMSIIAEHLDLTVTGSQNVNALSWGKNSKAVIKSSSTNFESNLFYFKEGIVTYETKYYYGAVIGTDVILSNTSPRIENDYIGAPYLGDFPVEVDWGLVGDEVGSVTEKLEKLEWNFGSAREVRK